MGTSYYAICDTCKEYTRIGKFGDWCQSPEDEGRKYVSGWIWRAVLFHKFTELHNGHQIGLWQEFTWSDEPYGGDHRTAANYRRVEVNMDDCPPYTVGRNRPTVGKILSGRNMIDSC